MTAIKIESIRIDGGTQPRTAIDEGVVGEYAEALAAGAVFPPVVVFNDGANRWLADGFHRLHAHRKAGRPSIEADERVGGQRDAILYSVGANGAHGLRRTNDDKRKAVGTLLADAEWATWSDRQIADACGVSHPLVAKIRSSLETDSSEKPAERRVTTKHGTETVMKTGGIAQANQQRTKPEAAKQQAPQDAGPAADDDAPSLPELVDELQRENEALAGQLKAVAADDPAAEALKWRKAYDHAVRQQSEAMERAAESTKRESWVMRQLTRCGKAVGEDDPTKIAAAVEGAVRKLAGKVAA